MTVDSGEIRQVSATGLAVALVRAMAPINGATMSLATKPDGGRRVVVDLPSAAETAVRAGSVPMGALS